MTLSLGLLLPLSALYIEMYEYFSPPETHVGVLEPTSYSVFLSPVLVAEVRLIAAIPVEL